MIVNSYQHPCFRLRFRVADVYSTDERWMSAQDIRVLPGAMGVRVRTLLFGSTLWSVYRSYDIYYDFWTSSGWGRFVREYAPLEMDNWCPLPRNWSDQIVTSAM